MLARGAQLAVRRRRVRDLWAETFGPCLVTLHVVLEGGCGRNINRGSEEFEDQTATQSNSLGFGLYSHSGFGFPGATGDESTRALHFDDADPADIHRSQGFEKTQRRHVYSEAAACIEQRRTLANRNIQAINRKLHRPSHWLCSADRDRS